MMIGQKEQSSINDKHNLNMGETKRKHNINLNDITYGQHETRGNKRKKSINCLKQSQLRQKYIKSQHTNYIGQYKWHIHWILKEVDAFKTCNFIILHHPSFFNHAFIDYKCKKH